MKSFRMKMICILLGVSLVPLIVATVYSYNILSKNLYQKINMETMSSIEMLAKSIDNELQRLTADMEIVTSSKEFQHAMNQIRTSRTDGDCWVALQDMDEMMIGMFGKSKGVSGVYITMPDGVTYAIQDKYHTDLKAFSRNSWFIGKDIGFSSIVSRGIEPMQDGRNALIFGKLIRDVTDLGNLAEIGSVHFAIDPALFSSVMVQNKEDSALFLINNDGQVVVSQCQEEESDYYYRLIKDNIMQMKETSGVIPVVANESKMVMIYDTSPLYRYQMVRFIPFPIYNSEIKNITWITILFALLCIIIVVLVSVLISKNISKPVNILSKAMQYTEKGNFDVQLDCNRKDELGDITRSFNRMVRQLNSFFKQIIENEKAKKNLEIRSLQYQISPHFLYNLLASVRSLAVIEKAKETSEMLSAVSKLLKNTVGYAGMLIPLYQETENVRRLLFIQNMCHNGLIKWDLDLQKGTEEFLVPNLIMQPIVENAVFYSADMNTGEVEINISIRKEKERLEIIIQDHGAGISEERQKEIFRENNHKGQFTHVGLFNTRERIRLNFGSPYDLMLSSNSKGTKVVITLPLLLEEEEIVLTPG